MKRLAAKAQPYEKQVAAALVHERIDSLILDELRALGALLPGSDCFRVLADRKLPPTDAALAIQLASQRYVDAQQYARWLERRATLRAPTTTEPLAYFLKLLEEASEALRLRH